MHAKAPQASKHSQSGRRYGTSHRTLDTTLCSFASRTAVTVLALPAAFCQRDTADGDLGCSGSRQLAGGAGSVAASNFPDAGGATDAGTGAAGTKAAAG